MTDCFTPVSSGGVNKAVPFAAESPMNVPIPGGPLDPSNPDPTVWYDLAALHVSTSSDNLSAGYCRGGGFARDMTTPNEANNNQRFYWGQPDDPIWTITLGNYIADGYNRHRTATTITMRGPATMWGASSADHYFCLISEFGDDQGNEAGDFVEVIDAAIVNSTAKTVASSDINAWARGNITTDWGCGSTVSGDPNGMGALNKGTNDGIRATNMVHILGAVTGWDWTYAMANGRIDHGFALVLGQGLLYGHGGAPARATITAGVISAGNYIDPATCFDTAGHAGAIRCGSVIGIPASFTMPASIGVAVGASSSVDGLAGYTPGKWFFEAMQNYRSIVGDFAVDTPILFANDNATISDVVNPIASGVGYGINSLFGIFEGGNYHCPAYSGTRTYEAGQLVITGGIVYQSLVDSNHANAPASSPAQWRSQAYDSGRTFAMGEVCSSGGAGYVSLQDGNVGHALPTPPATSAYWVPCRYGLPTFLDVISVFWRVGDYQP